MDNDFFLNSGVPPPPLHFESTSSSAAAWNSLSLSPAAAMDSFLHPSHWERPTADQSHFDFDSTLSSMVSSPAASNSNLSNDGFAVRELIGKLGTIGNPGEISASHNYNTPMNSPPKLSLPNLVKSGPLNSTVAEFSADPGFAERAARFSCFGSRSFNGRTNTTQLSLGQFRSNPSPGNGKLSRVSSSPSLKALANSQPLMAAQLVNSQEESTVSEQNPVGENEDALKPPNELNSRKRKAVTKGKGKDSAPTQLAKGSEADGDSNSKRSKGAEANGKETEEDEKKQSNQKPPEAPKDYIHVRARRGQATDSHSLAERVRREKIGERMKLLQDLVPGCNKVTGKALMLDEIINYVQSLQRQAEFLSMKLASVNTTSAGFDMDSLVSKNMFESNTTSMPQPIFPLDSSAFFGQQNEALHGHISNGTPHESSVDPLDSALCRNLDAYCQGPPQYRTFCGDDLQSIVQMGFAQNPALLSQKVQGSTQEPSPMKIEL